MKHLSKSNGDFITASPIETLLPRLSGVHKNGVDTWTARCPAHNDKHPSLSIRELDDGRVLVHCFANCAFEDILAAVGLTAADLFPPRPKNFSHFGGGALTHPFPAADVLRAVGFESLVCAVGASRALHGGLTEAGKNRMMLAAGRLRTAARYSGFGG
jgi:hypothetical protein